MQTKRIHSTVFQKIAVISGIFLIFSPVICAASSSSELQDLSKISTEVDNLFIGVNKPHAPGAIVAVTKSGKYLHLRGYGRMNVEHDLPWTVDCRSRLYSASKHFVGVAVLMMEDRGELRLDDDVRKYLPEMPDYGEKITIRHLLTNTSGLRDDETTLQMFGFYDSYPISLDYIYHEVITKQKTLNFIPGSACVYSNSGFRLIAIIIERISGQPFPRWMAENIFIPLGMEKTLVAQYDYEVVEDMASGYDVRQDGTFKKSLLRVGTSGDGGIVSTIPDMLKWIENLQNNKLRIRNFPARLVAKKRLNDGRFSPYGLGINTFNPSGLKIFHHSGGAAGYRFYFALYPECLYYFIALESLTKCSRFLTVELQHIKTA